MEFFAEIKEYIRNHRTLVQWFVGFSIVVFAGSCVLVPYLLAQLPADYFTHRRRRRTEFAYRHPFARSLGKFGKNVGGVALIMVGALMFIPPGLGTLTMFAGLVLMDFPGKYKLERWAVNRGPVLRAVNWLRARFDKPPLEVWKRKNPLPKLEAGSGGVIRRIYFFGTPYLASFLATSAP